MAMLLHLFVLFQFFTCGDLAFVGQLPSENEESQNQGKIFIILYFKNLILKSSWYPVYIPIL